MKSIFSLHRLVPGLSVLALILSTATATLALPPTIDQDLVGLNFHKPVSDNELIALLKDHSAQSLVFYFVAGDLYGTHRARPSTDTAVALAELRAEVIKMQRGARAGAILRARGFLNRASAASLEGDEQLHREAAYILHRYKASEVIENEALLRKPFVYAVEALVPRSNLSPLRRDPAVAMLTEAELRETPAGKARFVPAPERPQTARENLKELESWTSASLYEAIVRLSELPGLDGEISH